MNQHIKNKEYFLCAFDSKTRMEEVFEKVLDIAQTDDFIKISADENDITDDVQEEWKNKYVLYTPKIIYGVDFNPVQCLFYRRLLRLTLFKFLNKCVIVEISKKFIFTLTMCIMI